MGAFGGRAGSEESKDCIFPESALVELSCWGIGLGQEGPEQEAGRVGGAAGSCRAAGAPGSFQSAASAETSRHTCSLQEWNLGFLQPTGKPHWFPNQPRGLVFPVLDPWYPMWGSNPSVFREDP